MTKNYLPVASHKHKKDHIYLWILLFVNSLAPVFSQQTYSFTNCSITGQNGPNQAQVNTAYSLTNLNGAVTVNTIGIQQWIVPSSGNYRIEAYGAQGGNSPSSAGGLGAKIQGDFNLSAGTILHIVVGQSGTNGSNGGGGGGGGTGVRQNGILLIAAGGGGGAAWGANGVGGTVTISGGSSSSGVILGGTAGNGGNAAGINNNGGGCGGGGMFSAGVDPGGTATTGGTGGFAATGGAGNINYCNGTGGAGGFGIGGGGGGESQGGGAGGGGGYSGGAAGEWAAQAWCNFTNGFGGGGGGSYNNGINQNNASGVRTGHGLVVITALCNISLNATNTVICSGQSVTLTTDAVSNYSWSTGASTSSIVMSPVTNTTYTLGAVSPSACVASNSILIVVNSPTTVVASASSTNICAGKPVTLTGSGVNTYTWNNGAGTNTNNIVTYTPSATTGYTLTGTNACGNSSVVVTVSVLPLPVIGATASSPSICSTNTVLVSGNGGVGSYTWSPNVGNNTQFTPLATNNYTVTGAGANGCTNTAVVNILVINTPTATPVATPTAICVGQTATVTSGGATGYTWTAPGFGGSNNFSVAVSPVTTTTYTIVRANGTCSSTTQLTMVVNNLPPISVGGSPSTVCACTQSVGLTAVGAITYTWLPIGSQVSSVTVYPCTTTIYTVGASNSFCTTYSTVLITVLPTPTITIAPSSPTLCMGSMLTLTVSGAPTYTWTRQTNPSVPIVLPNTAIISDTPPNSALYNVVGTAVNGCTSSATQVILVNPNPTLSIASSNSFACNGSSTTLTASNAAPLPPVTYSWSTNQASPSIVVSPTITTNYTVKATYQTGCSTTSVYPLTVYIATFAVATPTAICSTSPYTLSALGGATSFTWGTSPVQTGSTAVVAPSVTTVYTVTGANGQCSTVRNVTMNVNPLPPVNISTPKWVICLFDGAVLTANGAVSYTWTAPEGTDESPSITFTTTGDGGPGGKPTTTTTFTLTGKDNNLCVKTITATVFVSNCTGIAEQGRSAGAGIDVFPNPNNGEFTIRSSSPMKVAVINELGQTVQNISLEGTEGSASVSGLPNGIYFIIGQNNGQSFAKKIVVNR